MTFSITLKTPTPHKIFWKLLLSSSGEHIVF
jgi:hypothetical protein